MQPGKTWYHPEGGFSFSLVGAHQDICDKPLYFPLHSEYGVGKEFQCGLVRIKTGLPKKPFMGRTISLEVTAGADTGEVMMVTVKATTGDEAEVVAAAWKDELNRTFAWKETTAGIPYKLGKKFTLTGSFDDSSQFRVYFEVQGGAATLKYRTIMYHKGGSSDTGPSGTISGGGASTDFPPTAVIYATAPST